MKFQFMVFESRRCSLLRNLATNSFLGISGCTTFSTDRTVTLPRYVTHAMGEIDGEVYTNSLEAWRANYEKGCRCFEVDFWRTSDNKVVAYHEGLREKYGLPDGFTADQFMQSKFGDTYSPLDAQGIASLMKKKEDWFLVTDVKNGFLRNLVRLRSALSEENVNYRDRVFPQIYNFVYNLPVVRSLGFDKAIFTLYRSSLTDEQVLHKVKKCDTIKAVTMSEERYSKNFVQQLNERGVPSYVHTVNKKGKIEDYINAGVRGVYTDSGCENIG